MIYGVVNTKGGVGKTTIAVHLAAYLSTKGKTLLIDGDPQASSASWAAWRRDSDQKYPFNPTTTCLTGKAIYSEGRDLSSGFMNTVIDAGGRDTSGLRSTLLLCQKAIVPVGASNMDAAALSDLLEVIDIARDYNSDLTIHILLSRIDPRTKDSAEMLAFLEDQNLTVLSSQICERVAFRRAIGEGATVAEIKKDTAAITEITHFFEEITA